MQINKRESMLNFNDFQDIISEKSFDEQSEDVNNFLKEPNFNFKEFITKIILKDNLIDIESHIDPE